MRAVEFASGFAAPDVTETAEDEPEPLTLGTLGDIFWEGVTPVDAEALLEVRSARSQNVPQPLRTTRSRAAGGRRGSNP